MLTAAVSFYDVVLWLHVAAVVVGFGSTFAYGVLTAVVARTDARAVPALMRGIAANDRSLVTVAAIIVLLTGLFLAADDRWEFSDFFIGWGIIAVLVLFGLLHGFFLPVGRRAGDAAAHDVEAAGSGEVQLGEEFQRQNAKLSRMGTVAGLIVVLTIYVMVAKPFL